MRSGEFNIYKSSGAAQFRLILPKFDDRGYIDKDGGIHLECAPGDGNKEDPKWDWSKKINISLGLADIAILMDQTKAQVRLVHDYKGVIKTLRLEPGVGNYEGTYKLYLSEGPKESRKEVMVPLSNGEYNLLMRLISSVTPILINWTNG